MSLHAVENPATESKKCQLPRDERGRFEGLTIDPGAKLEILARLLGPTCLTGGKLSADLRQRLIERYAEASEVEKNNIRRILQHGQSLEEKAVNSTELESPAAS